MYTYRISLHVVTLYCCNGFGGAEPIENIPACIYMCMHAGIFSVGSAPPIKNSPMYTYVAKISKIVKWENISLRMSK